jgi:hypothetical protein
MVWQEAVCIYDGKWVMVKPVNKPLGVAVTAPLCKELNQVINIVRKSHRKRCIYA